MTAVDSTDKVLPNTEAMRDALELLNGMDDESFANLVASVLDAVSSSSSSMSVATTSAAASATATKANRQSIAQEAAVRFITYQLTYFAVSKHHHAVVALTEEVTSASSAEVTSLSPEKAEVFANLWVEKGKDIVQQARTSLIRKVCNGTNAASAVLAYGTNTMTTSSAASSSNALREPHTHCTTAITMGEGSVLEIQPDTAEGVVKVTRAAQSMDFIPQALLTLPGGATVEMSEEEAYTLFSELDAIQRHMDSLFSGA